MRVISVPAILFLMVFSLPAAAANPCKQLANLPADTNSLENHDSVFGDMFGLGGSAPSASDVASFDLFFTTTTNYSIQPNCNKHGGSTRGNGLFYPIGLVVRKFDEATIGQKKYILVEADHGLRMYIPERDLAPLKSDKVYFFADSHRPTPYCGPNAVECKFTAEEKKLDSGEKGPEINPRLRWAVADREKVEGEITIDELKTCQNVDVEIFNRGKPTKAYEKAKLPVCTDNDDGPTFNDRIKVVTVETYRKLFETGISGAYVHFEENVLQKILPKTTKLKPCGIKKLNQIEAVGEGGGKIDVDVYFVKFSVGGQLQFLNKEVLTLGDKLFIHYGGFALKVGNRRKDIETKLAIQTLYECDSGTLEPDKPRKITLFHPLLGSRDISMAVKGVEAKYKGIDDEVALAISSDHQWFKEGKLWEITDHIRFFMYREAIREEIIYDQAQSIQKLLAVEDVELTPEQESYRRTRMEDFVVHLTLAIATRFRCSRRNRDTCPETSR